MPNKADGSVLIAVRADTDQASKDFAKMNKEIAQGEKELERETEKRDAISEKFEKASYKANELGANLKKLKAELAQVNQTLNFHEYDIPTPSVEEVIQATEREKELKAEIAAQTKEFDAQVKLVDRLHKKEQASAETLDRITRELSQQKTQAGETAKKITVGQYAIAAMDKQQKKVTSSVRRTNREHTKTPKLIQKGTQAIKQLGMRMVSLVASAFVFSVITKALTNLREHFSEIIKTNDRTAGALARLKGALLTMVQPIVDFVIPRFETLLNVLTRVATVAAAVMAKLFGTTIEESSKAAESLQDQIDGVEGLGKAAQKSFASFDQINVISTTQDSGGTAGGEIKPDFNITEDLTDKDMDRVDQIVERLKEIADFVKNDINPPLETLKSTWSDIQESFQEVPSMSEITLPTIISALTSVPLSSLNNLSIMISSLTKTFAGLSKVVQGDFSGLWDVANALKNMYPALLTFPIDMLTNIIDLMFSLAGIQIDASGWWAGIKQSFIEADLETFFKNELNSPLRQLFNQLGIDLDEIFAGVKTGIITYFTEAWTNISTTWVNVATWFNDNIVVPLSGYFASVKQTLEDVFNGAWIVISAVWTVASTWFNDNVITPVKTAFINAWGEILNPLRERFLETWEKIANGFKIAFAAVKVFAVNIFNNGIITALENGINAVVDGINKLLTGFNKVVLWGSDVLGKDWPGIKLLPKVTLPRIPELATGAVIPPNREFLAILGDQRSGTNIETPEALLRQIMREEMNSGNGMPREISITIKAAAGLPRYLKYELDAETRRQGGKLVEGTV